jgi:hypothetical protein
VNFRPCIIAIVIAGLAANSQVSSAQSTRKPRVAPTAVGSVLGVLSGGLVGAIAGGGYTSRDCPTGDPDACLGAAFPGFLWGAGIGATVGAPVGAWVGSGRRGSLPQSLLVSSLMFGAEVLALRSIVKDGRTNHEAAALTIVSIVPVLQVIVSTYIHTKRAPD